MKYTRLYDRIGRMLLSIELIILSSHFGQYLLFAPAISTTDLLGTLAITIYPPSTPLFSFQLSLVTQEPDMQLFLASHSVNFSS